MLNSSAPSFFLSLFQTGIKTPNGPTAKCKRKSKRYHGTAVQQRHSDCPAMPLSTALLFAFIGCLSGQKSQDKIRLRTYAHMHKG